MSLLSILSKGRFEKEQNLLKINPQFSLAFDYINLHYKEGITIKEIANETHQSISTLERNFKSIIGKTPNQYLKDLRLSKAAQLLKDGESVLDACMKSGFSDYSLFIQTFKKEFGTTPLKYKKK